MKNIFKIRRKFINLSNLCFGQMIIQLLSGHRSDKPFHILIQYKQNIAQLAKRDTPPFKNIKSIHLLIHEIGLTFFFSRGNIFFQEIFASVIKKHRASSVVGWDAAWG